MGAGMNGSTPDEATNTHQWTYHTLCIYTNLHPGSNPWHIYPVTCWPQRSSHLTYQFFYRYVGDKAICGWLGSSAPVSITPVVNLETAYELVHVLYG